MVGLYRSELTLRFVEPCSAKALALKSNFAGGSPPPDFPGLGRKLALAPTGTATQLGTTKAHMVWDWRHNFWQNLFR